MQLLQSLYDFFSMKPFPTRDFENTFKGTDKIWAFFSLCLYNDIETWTLYISVVMSVQRTATRHCNRWNALWNLLHLLVDEVRLSKVECVYGRVTKLSVNKVSWRNDRITGNIKFKKKPLNEWCSPLLPIPPPPHCQISPSTPCSRTPSNYVLPFFGQTNLHILTKQDKVSRFCTFSSLFEKR